MADCAPGNQVPISQVGVIVSNLEASMRAYHETLGWGPWEVFERTPPTLNRVELRGRPVECSFLMAEAQVGPVGYELIQPVSGESIYAEWLAEHGEGIHHVASIYRVRRDAEELLDRLARRGVRPLMHGWIGDSIRFCYLSSQPLLKIVLEVVSSPGGTDPCDRVYPR